MKKTLLKITTCILFAAAIVGVPAAHAADTNSAAKSDAAGPAKFYGPVTAVDTNAMTFTVGEQTFAVTGESQLTKNAKPATLADAVVGEPARGSYTKGGDGKLTVTKVRFGKAGGKSGGGKSGGKKKKDATATDSTTPPAAPQN